MRGVTRGVFLVGMLVICWGVFQLGKRINYRLAYKALVEETVRDMVRPEALR